MPDQKGYLLTRERQSLLQKYAPVLVLFPEMPDQAPYPDEGDAIYTLRGSYHPRSVDLFLAQAKVRYRWSALLRAPGLRRNPRSYGEEYQRAQQSVTEKEVDQLIASAQLIQFVQDGDQDPRGEVRKHLAQERLIRRMHGFDLPLFRGQNIAQWQQYFKLLAEAPPQASRSVVYGRAVQGNAPLDEGQPAEAASVTLFNLGPYDVSRCRIALQYWFQYYYDDWANRHEGDWESVTLLVQLGESVIRQARELSEAELTEGIDVLEAGYAAHEDGYRRQWQDVQKTADGRPIVYVARGSSASYFAWRIDGYPASARIGVVEQAAALPGRLLQGRRFLGRRWDALYAARFTGRDPKNTDWVAADPLPEDRTGSGGETSGEVRLAGICRGVRRHPAFDSSAGLDEATYHLETEDSFWLEMVQEYGLQWGENSMLPGSKGPGGMNRAARDKLRLEIQQFASIEALIQQALRALTGVRLSTDNAIPELDRALRDLRPKQLKEKGCFPRIVHPYVFYFWAWILKSHPEAWRGGPGLRLRMIFRRIIYPGLWGFIRKSPTPNPLLTRDDPMYHLKSLLAQVQRIRYERQHVGAKWDNPFAWVRYVCHADTFFYGKARPQASTPDQIYYQLDCIDTQMTME
jgi:hypothetical protein